MLQAEWLTSNNSARMLEWLLGVWAVEEAHPNDCPIRPTNRQLRMFCCACCHHYGVQDDLDPERDRIGGDQTWALAWTTLVPDNQNRLYSYKTKRPEPDIRPHILRDIFDYLHEDTFACEGRSGGGFPRNHNIFNGECEYCGEHYSWFSSTVQSLITTIYQEEAFERMPILADAMEDAGCTNTNVLNHCRSGGLHVRGCWVLDLAR